MVRISSFAFAIISRGVKGLFTFCTVARLQQNIESYDLINISVLVFNKYTVCKGLSDQEVFSVGGSQLSIDEGFFGVHLSSSVHFIDCREKTDHDAEQGDYGGVDVRLHKRVGHSCFRVGF